MENTHSKSQPQVHFFLEEFHLLFGNLLETQQELRIAVLSFSYSVTRRDKTEEDLNLTLPHQILKILGTVEEPLSSSGKRTWSMLAEIVPN